MVRLAIALAAFVALTTLAACNGKALRLGTAPDGASHGTACQRGQVKGAEVVWIGDSWITRTGSQHTRVRDLARAAGALGPTEEYVIAAADGALIAAIASQYATAEARATKVKVLVMDGGTFDTILMGTSDALVAKVVETFQQLLTRIAADGTVEHIIYFLQPELPTISGVAPLRSGLMQACAASSVPCHFLNLQEHWAGNDTASDGIQASEIGSLLIADAIWEIMRVNCIAQ